MSEIARTIRVRTAQALALGAVAVPALLLGATSAVADDASEIGTKSVADCRALDLKITEQSRQGAAGSVEITFTLEKLPPQKPSDDEACVMYGDLAKLYWGDSEGNPLGALAVQDDNEVKPFGLFPGDKATVSVTRPNPENFPKKKCKPVAVAGAHFFFHNDEGVQYVPTDGKDRVCSNPKVGASRISAITPVDA